MKNKPKMNDLNLIQNRDGKSKTTGASWRALDADIEFSMERNATDGAQ